MKKLIRLIEAGEKTAFVNSKAVQYTDERELQDLKDNPDVRSISTAQGKKIKEEAGRKYTAEEAQAVGKVIAKSLVKVLRGQGDEVVNIKLTGVGTNKFNIHVTYGNDKGQDTFKFKLNPESEDIYIETQEGDQVLTDFLITQGNTVSLPTPELESKLAEVMKKYVSEPSPEEYDQMAAMEPESDPSQIGKYIPEADFNDPIAMKLRAAKMAKPQPVPIKQKPAIDNSAKIKALEKERERIMFDMEQEAEPEGGPIADRYGVMLNRIDNAINKLRGFNQEKDADISQAEIERRARMIKENISEVTKHVGDKYVNYPKEGGKRLGTFPSKKAAQKQLAAIEISKQKKNEELDPVGKEDKDINNDGKVDSTDKYLANRRQAIAKNMKEDLDVGHQDDEPGMLKSDVYRIAKMASMLYKQLDKYDRIGEVDFPHWWQAKIVKAYDYLQSAYGYLDAEQNTNNMDTTVVATMALQEKKGTCCHKCGHVHVKGESHPTPYLTGKKNCKFRD